ncbi:TIGR02147 family protein [Bdellovibrio sp. 22V]|uniref:TIGR02147 family protein n=1 Tax=Bdellovibrio TaxID=958 RepID=UPI0025426D98|nr:TIGR02147 family protein [Bdellovibrio sp. 22V]WII71221.1 TIGR02147 family protein [Bdellovibrio sp. 22V]
MEPSREKRKKVTATNFRSLLQAELVERCRFNPSYSLRAFARSLRVEPSALSQMINGKRPITEKMKLRLGSALGLSVEQIRRLPVSEQEESFNSHEPQKQSLDEFALISDWYHYAILELTHVFDFKPESGWISRRLGITKSEANIAIERLFRMNLLRKEKSHHWVETSENGELTHLTPAQTSDAARKYQIQLLELSQRTVQEVELTQRNHTSATFCFDAADMTEAVKRITEFRRAFAREFRRPKNGKEVYQMQISFFPLTTKK